MRAWVLSFLLVACGKQAPTLTLPRQAPADSVDLDATNLSAKEELDALLAGLPSVGRTVDPIRVAVPRLQVTGSDGWLGEAAADIIASELATARGVIGIDRGEVGEIAVTDAVARGKAIGAHAVVLGSLTRGDGGQLAVELTFVHVGSGELHRSTTRAMPDQLDAALRTQVTAGFARYGVKLGGKATTLRPLPLDRLEKAARARALQLQGKLLEAQPLYAAALAEPSSAWRFEADYLRLMNDLGQYEWSANHAKTVLSRMPDDAAMLCDRARISVQRDRFELVVRDVRESVRMAASCGDSQLVGVALFHYSNALEPRHYPLAREAIDRAATLVSPKTQASTYCTIDYTRYRIGNDVELQRTTSMEEGYAKRARSCAAAGNLRFAARAMYSASLFAWNPVKRLEYATSAIDYAKGVGGDELDRARLGAANALRAAGRVSEADDRLLEAMHDHLAALVELYGALPFDEQKLDDDLLTRARISRPPGIPKEPSGSQALLARAHRQALASVLTAWADRTRPISTKQAAIYTAIATDISGKPPELEGHAKRLEVKHDLTVDKLLAMSKPPAYATARLTDIFWILDAMFFEVRDVADKRELADQIRKASKLVASWSGRTDLVFEAAILDIDMQVVRGDYEAALTSVRATERYVASSAWHRRRLLDRELWISGKQNDGKAIEIRERDVDAARKLDASTWIAALYWLENARFHARPTSYVDSVRTLETASRELADAGAIEPAAEALAHAANFMNWGQRADGTVQAVELHARRVALLERLNDPLRSAMARADMLKVVKDVFFYSYRGNLKKFLQQSTEATAMVASIAKTCGELAAAGRHRDAVRLVTNLPAEAKGVDALVEQALTWTKQFESSTEYWRLRSDLHYMRATIADDKREKIAQFDLSRQAAEKDKNLPYALIIYKLMMGHVVEEAELWNMYDNCVALGAPTAPLEQTECSLGLATALQLSNFSKRPDKQRAATALARATKLTPAADTSVGIQWRMDWRAAVAVLAGLASDREAFDLNLGVIEKHYTQTAPDPYLLATALSRIASGLKVTKESYVSDVLRKFYRANGVSDYWIATAAVNDALYADSVGDTALETEIVERLKRAVRTQPSYAYNVPSYAADRASRKKDFRKAEASYLEASETVRKNTPSELRLIREYQWHAAKAAGDRRDVAVARARIAPFVKEARATKTVAMPCFAMQALELAASVEYAARQCREADDLRALAAQVREQCTQVTCDTASSWFCDTPYSQKAYAANTCGKPFAIDYR